MTQGAHHWSYPQQGQLGTPRPDLSAIPVHSVDAPPWMPTVSMGSNVARAARLVAGDRPPSVPGQDDPRRIARLFGLSEKMIEDEVKEGYHPLRVLSGNDVQPPGPSPANRYHTFGVGTHALPPTASTKLMERPEPEASEEAEDTPAPDEEGERRVDPLRLS